MEDSFQKINISVKIIDNIPPIVKSKWKNLTISYKEINNFNIENYIEIYDATPIKEIKLLNLPQPYSIGIFLLKIIVIDSISNSTEIELNINVFVFNYFNFCCSTNRISIFIFCFACNKVNSFFIAIF